jgi:hypothetical protein
MHQENALPLGGSPFWLRVRIALLLSAAAMLPPLLKHFGENAKYFTFDVFSGILQPVWLGGLAIAGGLLSLLILEWPAGLQRFWLARLLAAAILVNLSLAIVQGAIHLDLPQLLSKLDLPSGVRHSRTLRDVFYVAVIALLAYKCRRPRFLAELYRLFVAVVVAFSLLAAYRAGPAVFTGLVEAWERPSATISRQERSVVWIIFDELDRTELTRVSGSGLLKHFDRVQESGLGATHAQSPSSQTVKSIPMLLTGAPLEAVAIAERELTVARVAAARQPLRDSSNVISSVQSRFGPVQILGFYHPYCRLFPAVADCRSYAIARVPGVSNYLAVAAHTLTLSQSKKVLKWFGIDSGWYSMDWADQMAHIARRQFGDTAAGLRLGTAALHFLHLNVPHLPRNKFADDTFAQQGHRSATSDDYLLNLRLADRILGRILQQIADAPANIEILLIVSGDHGRRPDNWRDQGVHKEAEAFRRVPLIVWTKDGRLAGKIEERIETLRTRQVIEGYLAGELTKLADFRSLLAPTR